MLPFIKEIDILECFY